MSGRVVHPSQTSETYAVNEKFCIAIRILLKFVPKSPADNKPALVQVMAPNLRSDETSNFE